MRFNIYKHVVNTWLLGLLVNQIIVITLLVREEPVLSNDAWGQIALSIILFFVLGIPALFISMILFRLIVLSSIQRPGAALALWCAAIIGAVCIEVAAPFALVLWDVDPAVYALAIPGAVAGVIAALIRWQQFYKIFFSLNRRIAFQPQSGPDGNDSLPNE
ncbi:MAG: hypothetical protein DI535_01050 [Citrobacter freundii]|nr:MAG: hypothetical protein DI535_01050 [Citrobacter freundii]